MSNVVQMETRAPKSVPELIEDAKDYLGVSQVELAGLLSASKDQLYRWKTGKVQMPEAPREKLDQIIGNGISRARNSGSSGPSSTSEKPKSGRSLAWQKFYDAHRPESFDLEVIPFLEMAYNFGFKFPGHVDEAGRATQSQVSQAIKEHAKSYDILSTWISVFLEAGEKSEAVNAALGELKSKLYTLAMAKMDLTSMFKQTIDKDQFSVRAYAVTVEVENEIKNLVKEFLEDGGVIYRNFFRLTSATNESLLAETTAYDEKSSDITQYFSLAERMLMREIKSIKNMISR